MNRKVFFIGVIILVITMTLIAWGLSSDFWSGVFITVDIEFVGYVVYNMFLKKDAPFRYNGEE